MTFWLFIACTQKILTSEGCEELQNAQARDTCRYQAFMELTPNQIDEAVSTAEAFEDSIVKGAAIVGWVQKHSREISPEGGEQLCEILTKTSEQAACKRRFSAAHLQR